MPITNWTWAREKEDGSRARKVGVWKKKRRSRIKRHGRRETIIIEMKTLRALRAWRKAQAVQTANTAKAEGAAFFAFKRVENAKSLVQANGEAKRHGDEG